MILRWFDPNAAQPLDRMSHAVLDFQRIWNMTLIIACKCDDTSPTNTRAFEATMPAARFGVSHSPRVAPLLVLASAFLLFSINLDRPPHPDEMHHALAAQHLLETGRPILDQGEYTRGIAYTWFVAISYEIFGEGLASARAPSVLFVAAVAAILFVWVRIEAGVLAAWIAAGFFITSPMTVEIAQFCRFYSLHTLSFLLGAICVYYAAAGEASPRRRVLLASAAMILFAFSFWLQDTTLMGLAGVAVWAGGALVQRTFFNPAMSSAAKRWLLVVLILAGVVVILAATSSGWLQSMIHGYRRTPLFSAPTRTEFWFYHARFLILYPTLWSLVGILAICAMLKVPRLSWYAVIVFSTSFLVASFGGMKATRYLSFAQPFLAIVWGVGLAALAPVLSRGSQAATDRLIASDVIPKRAATAIGTTVIAVGALSVILMNPFWLRSAAMIRNVALPGEIPTTDWRAARNALAWWTENADIMITTEELGAIYFLGRSDVRYSPSKLGEIASRGQGFEFGIDWRTGRPVISKPESVERLIECFPADSSLDRSRIGVNPL